MNHLNGLKIAVCQMKVAPGLPKRNADYIISESRKAAEKGADIIVFPEMCISGYIIGDIYEDDAFINDVRGQHNRIAEETKEAGIFIIFGSIAVGKEGGEDGRMSKTNAAFIAHDGKSNLVATKTLQPNYRFFNDDRYFMSTRKIVEKCCSHLLYETAMINSLQPVGLSIRGMQISLGVILCEDMWHQDYAVNPSKILCENGAELIINLSASPWTWQKNRKRHQVVRDLLAECRVPFVYVNNTGIQNNGKNIIIFDGSSAIYNRDGGIVYEAVPYEAGAQIVELKDDMSVFEPRKQSDSKELFESITYAIREFFYSFPPNMREVVIGLSGGIDSALSAALLAYVLGPDKVHAVNMPSHYNSLVTQNLAKKIAENLGISYEVRPIGGIVDAIVRATGVDTENLGYENIQARARMEILNAIAQEKGWVFPANWNKVEAAFGYGTLYGDMAGCVAILGDLIKREVRQIADYMNREVFDQEVIPNECINQAPSAELKHNQVDPFDYGNLERRGYHDEMVRAIVTFRKNPEWFLEMYIKGELEKELKLKEGTISGLFPRPIDFINDLEKNWQRYHNSYFKRVQGPPIPVVSKRAFGDDLKESILGPYLTARYLELKANLFIKEEAA